MKPVDPKDFAADRMLKNLQGNTLKGHGRNHTTHIFFRFCDDKTDDAIKWIRTFAEDHLTSMKKQLEERETFKKDKKPGDIFAAFFLTATGYGTLGLEKVDKKLTDEAFLAGLKKRKGEINDPDSSKWEEGFKEEIHAMVLLADHDLARMGNFTKGLIDTIKTFGDIRVVEYGNAIRNSNNDGIEHFGYVDGTSQPLFLKDEIEDYEELHRVKLCPPAGDIKFNPFADKELILIQDPYVEEAAGKKAYGSYFVFRKLEQNVRAFKRAEEKVGELLFPNEGDEFRRELAGAYLVGRFEDGTPVVMDDEDGIPNSAKFNNFDYSNDDPSGGRCPHFAHVRMTNGRPADNRFQNQRMARRGIPFGHRDVDTELDPIAEQTPEGGVGLLFMSYQNSIVEQFEAVQKAANTLLDNGEYKVLDPIIGQSVSGDPRANRMYSLPKTYGKKGLADPAEFRQFVSMKGGEYFFAPSILFLKSLRSRIEIGFERPVSNRIKELANKC